MTNQIVAYQVIEGHGKCLLEIRIEDPSTTYDCLRKAEVLASLMASDGDRVRVCPVFGQAFEKEA